MVRDGCRWEHAGEPFFSGEVEPCINGRVVALGTYFDQDVDAIVARLLVEQFKDGGWNCEVENGSVRSSFATTIKRPGRTIGLRAGNRWLQGIHRGSAPGRGVPSRTKTVPTKEHRRGRQPSLAALLVSNPLELRRAARPRILPIGRRYAGPADG